MPCDAACIKIIINTRFMAALAPVLANQHDGRRWIKNDAVPETRMLEKWTAEMWVAIDDLTVGKFPGS